MKSLKTEISLFVDRHYWRIVAVLALIIILVGLISCRTTSSMSATTTDYRTVEKIRQDIIRDTTYVRDSIFMQARGCTLTVYKFRDRYHTIRDCKTDTLRDTVRIVQTRTEVKTIDRTKPYLKVKLVFCAVILVAVFMLYNIFCKKRQF